MDHILLPTEIEFYIETMTPQSIKNIGSKQWLEWHQRLQKLNQQALIEASQMMEERVKETLVSFEKAPILVHEAILINIWKFKVLPQMLKLYPDPPNTFMAYTILYHEAVCASLLELVMYHANCCDTLGDTADDLLDYACGIASRLLSVKSMDPGIHETGSMELSRQMDDLSFDIGIRSLSIIRYLAQYLDRVSLSICSKIYETHDVPMLFVQLLIDKPWVDAKNRLYCSGKWTVWDGEALGQAEAQVWLALHCLIFDPAFGTHYSMTDNRRSKFVRLISMLTPTVMDQLSPLMDLKQFLSQICMSGGEQSSTSQRPILLEIVLEVKEKILNEVDGKWKKLARDQLSVVFCNDQKTLMETAQILSTAYNTDLLENFEDKPKSMCEQCGKNAIQRCSHCKQAWYCSRSCQVTHWSQHKEGCNKEM